MTDFDKGFDKGFDAALMQVATELRKKASDYLSRPNGSYIYTKDFAKFLIDASLELEKATNHD